MKSFLASVAAAAIIASTLIASAKSAPQSPIEACIAQGGAVARATIIAEDGTIRTVTRCVLVSK